jgi:hypothetical protein
MGVLGKLIPCAKRNCGTDQLGEQLDMLQHLRQQIVECLGWVFCARPCGDLRLARFARLIAGTFDDSQLENLRGQRDDA